MAPAALVNLLLIGGIVWGGFVLILSTALRSESRKTAGGAGGAARSVPT